MYLQSDNTKRVISREQGLFQVDVMITWKFIVYNFIMIEDYYDLSSSTVQLDPQTTEECD